MNRQLLKLACAFLFLHFPILIPTAGVFGQTDTKDESQAESESVPKIEDRTKGLSRVDGFLPFYWDEKDGSILLEINQMDQEFLYVHSLATGLGSNPVGLDRGQLGSQKVVRFTRVGPKVMLLERNLRFRAITDNELERQSVEQSFAQSIVWGGKVAAESDGRILVDITSLLMSDVHGVIKTLSDNDQGDFSLDETRSAMYLPRCKAFPDNTELEATLTFSGKNPGSHVRQTTPTSTAVTLRQHHSFIRLPDDNYRPREYDVRSPCIEITFADYATPLQSPLQKRWIVRHRLQKKNPDAAMSEPVEPIVYYVDAGAPALIQQALVEGASWWNEAFEAAGFKNAFQVKLLPPDADPLDVRYNVIQWVHRSTRGWSYGGSVVDPRTGEILKGHVTLGSLRVRQDMLLVNGMANNQMGGGDNCACCGIAGIAEEATLADLDARTEAKEVALARIRQLSAHEVGHTLGFVHNFAASTYADRASVMDYPAPRINIDGANQLDLSDAYGVGIGEWDKLSVRFAYSEYADPKVEAAELDRMLVEAEKKGMIFISDSDARPAHAAHPLGNLWDNGSDPLVELRHVMKVRQIALDQFDPTKLPVPTTSADIAQYYTPVYLHHRYQLNAVGKLIGGYYYSYGYSNVGSANQMVAVDTQLAAIDALLDTIRPEALQVSAKVQQAISPRPYGTIRDQEILPTQTGRMFDPLAAARVAAEMTFSEMLQAQRLARLSIQARTESRLALQNVVPSIVQKVLNNSYGDGKTLERNQIGGVVVEVLVEHLIDLVDDGGASLEVRSAAFDSLTSMLEQRSLRAFGSAGKSMERQISQMLQRPAEKAPSRSPLRSPPGSPIGN